MAGIGRFCKMWPFLTFSLFFICVTTFKLNVPRVLLPYSQTVAANFTLEVTDGGCFSWYVSRPEVVKLHLIDEERRGCSMKAIVTSVSRQTNRQSALVIIRNDASGETLHCDVTVASIHELEITTTTRELLLEDTPEAFTVRAKDKEGDTFSSIDGLVFEWNLVTDTGSDEVIDAYKVLRFMKFSESLYKASSHIYHLESQGLRGYVMLVQGIKTGTAIVRATLKDAAYEELLSAEVTLTVIANLILWPSHEVFVLVGSIWKYEVHLIQHRKSTKIPMPSNQYYLTLSDATVAALDTDTSEIEARVVGYTMLLLKDRNIKSKQTFRQPSVGIHIVAPHHLRFTVLPHQNWYLILNNEYVLIVRVYDINNNELYISNNIRISTRISGEHFEILHQSKNGTYIHVRTKTLGTTTCWAVLEGLTDKAGYGVKFDLPLEESQELEIVEQVRLVPDVVILPWDPQTKSSYKVNLKVVGGGGYGVLWRTSNQSLATCDQAGDVTTKAIGSVNITASSLRNLHNYGLTMVSIVPPDGIEILTPAMEIELHSIAYISVALFTQLDKGKQSSRLAATDCTQYPFTLEITDPKRLEYLPDKVKHSVAKHSCASLPFLATSVGLARVAISLNTDEGIVQSSVVIVVYKPLSPVSPSSLEESILLVVGTSRRIVLEGGPKPWSVRTYSYFQELEIEKHAAVSASIIESPKINKELHVIHVLCKAIGETVVVLRVGNRNASTNIRSAVAEAKIYIVCAFPTAMQLHPEVWRPRLSHDICHSDGRTIAAHCYRDLDINVNVFDEHGRRFYNFSSLDIVWESSDSNLASFPPESALVTVDNVHDGYITQNRSYILLHPTGVEGRVRITASIRSYLESVLRSVGIESKLHIVRQVISSIMIDLVEDASFTEDVVSIFNHPSNKVSISVVKGSGQFDYDPKDQTIAEIRYSDKLHEFQIIPKVDGSFTLTLVDVCLASRSDAVVLVRVSGMKKIRVSMLDKVSLGKEITATVEILDQDGLALPPSVFPLIYVEPAVASNMISLRSISSFDSGSLAFQFYVKGNSLGLTTLSFTAKLKMPADASKMESPVSSDRMPIQVFSPLRLYPHNVTLIVGAVFQVSSFGGPMPQANIEFEVRNSDVASVVGGGIIEGQRLGVTVVIGRAVGIDAETGNRVVYSQDEVFVHVVPLTGIRIKSPLTRIQLGTMIPVYVVGTNDQEIPYAFGSAVPTLTFQWSSSNKDIASVQPFFRECGIHLLDDNHFATRLMAKQPGQITLSVRVYPSNQAQNNLVQVHNNAVLSDEIQIHVFEKLSLVFPPIESGTIVITPDTELKLATNKDRTSLVSHQLVKSYCSSPSNGVTVDRNGLLRSGKQECQASLLVTCVDEMGGNQTVASLVTVKPISYMMVVSKCSFQLKEKHLTVLPVGAKAPFVVHYYDNVGNAFHVTNSKLKFRPSRFDLIRIVPGTKNDTFYIRANKPGFSVVRVWDTENAGIEDYFLVSTGEIISPSRATVLLGDRICFTCLLADSQGLSGSWNTDDASVLQILPSGLSFATDIGTAMVIFNTSNNIVTSTELTVVPLQSVEFDSSHRGRFLTNAHVEKVFHFPLIVHGDNELSPISKTFTNIIGENCSSSDSTAVPSPFDCVIRFSSNLIEESVMELFSVREGFDFSSGRHECQVQAKPQQAPLARHYSTLTRDIELVAVVLSSAKQSFLTSESLKLPFHPGFFVHNMDVQVGDMHLVGNGVTISATDAVFRHLSVKSNDSTLVEVLPPVSDAANPSQHLYPIKLSDQFWKRVASEGAVVPDAHIEVFCSLTEHLVGVPVKFTLMSEKLGKCVDEYERSGWSGYLRIILNNYQSFAIIFLAVIGTVFALFIGYHSTIGQRPYAFTPQSGMFLNHSMSLGGGRIYPPGTPGFNLSASPPVMPSGDRPHLWSVNEPVLGSPTFTRTPSPRLRSTTDRYILT